MFKNVGSQVLSDSRTTYNLNWHKWVLKACLKVCNQVLPVTGKGRTRLINWHWAFTFQPCVSVCLIVCPYCDSMLTKQSSDCSLIVALPLCLLSPMCRMQEARTMVFNKKERSWVLELVQQFCSFSNDSAPKRPTLCPGDANFWVYRF